jgi:plasmid stabilization system protein ParE
MGKIVKLSLSAKIDLENQAAWYGRRSEAREEHFLAAVEKHLETIAERPEAAPFHGRKGRQKSQMKPPYRRFSIYYREQPDFIDVVAVWAGNRSPNKLKRR